MDRLEAPCEPGLLDDLQPRADDKRAGPWWLFVILALIGLSYLSIIYSSGRVLLRNSALVGETYSRLSLLLLAGVLIRGFAMVLVLRRSRWAWPLLFTEVVFATLVSLAQQLRFGAGRTPVLLAFLAAMLLLRGLVIAGLLQRRALAFFGTPDAWRLPAAFAGILLAAVYWFLAFRWVARL